jgi:xylose isomerase
MRETKYKIGSGLTPYSSCVDRFVPSGYSDALPFERQLEEAAKVRGLRGVAFDYPYQFKDPVRLRKQIDNVGLEMWTVELGLYPDRKWKLGTFTSPDPNIRRDAIKMCKDGLDAAAELKAVDVLLWPGQDGYDYPFQVDYVKAWDLLVEGLVEIAEHRPDVKIAVEYKPKEPRAHIHVGSVGTLLYLLRCVGKPNVGATIDLGHSLVAGEGPGEAVALLARDRKLFQVHVNDNYRDWDHDLIPGSVCFWESLEFFYWLRRVGYDGWLGMDIYPYRENGAAALQLCVANTERLMDMAAKLLESNLTAAQAKADPVLATQVVWDTILK